MALRALGLNLFATFLSRFIQHCFSVECAYLQPEILFLVLRIFHWVHCFHSYTNQYCSLHDWVRLVLEYHPGHCFSYYICIVKCILVTSDLAVEPIQQIRASTFVWLIGLVGAVWSRDVREERGEMGKKKEYSIDVSKKICCDFICKLSFNKYVNNDRIFILYVSLP